MRTVSNKGSLGISSLLFFCPRGPPRPGEYFVVMGMCRWVGSHFHDLIYYNETAFSTELLEWGRTFSNVRIMAVLVGRANKPGRAKAVMP